MALQMTDDDDSLSVICFDKDLLMSSFMPANSSPFKYWATLSVLCASLVSSGLEVWTNVHATVWSRSGAQSVSCERRGEASYAIRHTGTKDWALNGMPLMSVEPGEECILTCETKSLSGAGASVQRPCQPNLIARGEKGQVIDWYFLAADILPGQTYQKRFVVPEGVFGLQARVAGNGLYEGQIGPLVLTRTGRRQAPSALKPLALDSAALTVTVQPSNAVFSVVDKRTGRVWRMDTAAKDTGLPRTFRCVSALKKGTDEILLRFGSSDLAESTRSVRFELTGDELLVTIEFNRAERLGVLRYPQPFQTKKGDRLLVCKNEGMGYPVEEEHLELRGGTYACGYWLSMPFFGVLDDATGAGFLAISETHEDATLETYRLGPEKLWSAGPGWLSEWGTFGYPRRVRYVFVEKGGHVAQAKRFRAWAKRQGWVKTFQEKAIARPLVTRLAGAPNMWPFFPDGDKLAHAKELLALGMDRFLWSGGGTEEAIRFLSQQKDILVGRYDNAQDVFHPRLMARMGRPGVKGKWHDAFPMDCMWTSSDSNDWRRAWGIEIKEGTNVVMEHCATLCDARAPFYEYEYAAEELKTKPYTARFMDTTFSEPWKECRSPLHPMNRRESRFWRMEMLRMLQDRLGLVTGSERGSASTVPVCDYYEGMMSIAGCGLPRAGRDMQITWTNALPAACAKYQVGAAYRLPLWELVFHDCACAHWYWGDGNLKAPEIWARRDLFNVLYGTAPLFLYTKDQWPKFRDGIVATYKKICPTIRSVGLYEMVDHQILTPDRLVQRTVFANGLSITVNFSEKPWKDEAGRVLLPGEFVTCHL